MVLKKYKENKIFVTGVSGSGKTTFAKEYSKIYNINYFSFDENWNYYEDNIQQYEEIIYKYPDEFITDAIPYTIKNENLMFLDYYQKNKENIKIICLCCTNKDEFENRIKMKSFINKTRPYIEYYNYYFIALKKYYANLNIDYYDTYSNEFINENELFNRINWLNKNKLDELLLNNLKEHLNIQEYDKYYQDIECINLIGYSKSYNTWENIKNLVDWNEKKVADIGCFHCYFSFKVAKEGGLVTGFDINEGVLKTSEYLNEIEGGIISLMKWSGGDEISSDFDICLCLNVLHHFSDIKKSLENINSKIVIFETNTDLIKTISEYFFIIKTIKSHRVNAIGETRTILLCTKKCNP